MLKSSLYEITTLKICETILINRIIYFRNFISPTYISAYSTAKEQGKNCIEQYEKNSLGKL